MRPTAPKTLKREITEHDLDEHFTDDTPDRAVDGGQADRSRVDWAKAHVQPAESIDLRELAAAEDSGAEEDHVRILGQSKISTTQDVYMGRRAPGRHAADALEVISRSAP